MATQASLDLVQKIYIAYYGRPADPLGQSYWADAIDAANGDASAVINAFGTSAEATAIYGSLGAPAAVNNLYKQLFGRDADVAGLKYYVDGLNNGTFTLAGIALTIANGALDGDVTTLNAKIAAANAFTAAVDTTPEIIGYAGDAAAAAARTQLSAVVDTASSSTFVANVGNNVAEVVSVGSASQGETFTLTAAADNVVGTFGNDAITGVFGSATNADNTFNVGDLIDGGDGTDTLTLTAQDTNANTAALVLKNVENVVVRDLVGATVDALSIENNPTISFTNTVATKDSTVTNASTASTFGLAGKGNLVVDFASTSGSTDTAHVALSSVGTSTSARSTVNVADGNTIEAVTVATTGTNFVSLNAGSAAAKITVTGNGTNNFDVVSAAAALTLDASATTGTNTFAVGTVLSTTDTIKGGTGADTLSANLTAATLINPTITGVETLSLDFDAAATLNLSKTTGATTLNLSGSTADQTITSAAAELKTVNITSQGDADNDLNLSYVTGAATDLALNIGSTASTAAAITLDDVNLTNIDSLTINTVGTKALAFDATAVGALSELAINVGEDGDLNTGNFDSTGAINAVDLTVGVSGNLYVNDIEADALGNVDLSVATGGSGEADVWASAGNVGNVTVAAEGNDAQAYLWVGAYGSGASGGDIGNLSLTVNGTDASGYLEVDAYSGTVGTVTATGTGENVEVTISAYASGYSADASGSGFHGDIGAVNLSVDGKSGILSGYIEAYYGNVGDVTINVQGEEASGYVYVYAYDWGGSGVSAGASGDIGNVSLTIGDGASGGYYAFDASGSIGNANITIGSDVGSAYVSGYGYSGTTGDLTATIGDNSNVDLHWSNYSSGDIANVDVTVGADASAYVSAYVSGGDLNAVTIDAADGADVNLYATSINGSVGNIDVTGTAASAYVSVDGDVSVGEVTVAAAGNIGVNLSGDGATVFGAVVLTGGSEAGASGYVYANTSGSGGASITEVNTTGFAGDVTINLSEITTGTTIQVGNGGSHIIGTDGADNIFGGTGVDVIQGGTGVDVLIGGTGADVYVFSDVDADLDTVAANSAVTDVINGFVSGSDTLDFTTAGLVTNYAENTTTAASWAALTTAADTALDGTVQYYFGVFNGDGFLFQDTDGTGVTSVIQLTGVTDLAFTDIV